MTTVESGVSSMVVVANPPHSNLAGALAAFQAELPKMSKDERAKVKGKSEKTGEFYDRSYDYAGLDQFVEIVEPVLGKHGLAVTSKTTFDEHGNFVLEVSLVHESGERETAYWPLPDPRRYGPQDIGSSMTYGRRYLGWGLTGTFPGGIDDDGEKAQANVQRDRWENAKPKAEKPVSGPPAPEKDWSKATDAEVGDLHKRIETLPIGQAVNGYDWMAGKGLHNRNIPLVTDDGNFTVNATEVLAVRLADEAVKPDTVLAQIADLRAWADARGLLKIQVSEETTLDEELAMARDTKSGQAADLIDKTAAEVG